VAEARYAIVVPVYGNADNVEALLGAIAGQARSLDGPLEAVLVVDGSPDDSYERLARRLPEATADFSARLIDHSRNFGSFAAIRTGLAHVRAPFVAVMAADLQEPAELAVELLRAVEEGTVDVAVGTRRSRADGASRNASSSLFWRLYRRFVQPEMPAGGIDVFACTSQVRETILDLRESHSSLVGLLMWVGYRRVEIPYDRRAREAGESGWTFRKKLRYLSDSVFSFTDLPVRLLTSLGAFGVLVAALVALVVAIGRLTDSIRVPGYAPTVITIVFFGALNTFALGVIGSYVWRAFENTKQRPSALVVSVREYPRHRDG
jgi:glycosyltransferase involved in cell wall biosynthesis